jgi:hypothetical protein
LLLFPEAIATLSPHSAAFQNLLLLFFIYYAPCAIGF